MKRLRQLSQRVAEVLWYIEHEGFGCTAWSPHQFVARYEIGIRCDNTDCSGLAVDNPVFRDAGPTIESPLLLMVPPPCCWRQDFYDE